MSRLDPTGEPSMEEILASIRKIIAEDPPGSRPMPDAPQQSAATPLASRIFPRLDAIRSTPVTAQPFQRAEPTFSSPSSFAAPAPAAPPAVDVKEAASPFDIDAQMAEVLGKVRQAQSIAHDEPVSSTAVTADNEKKSSRPTLTEYAAKPAVQAALDSLLPSPFIPASAAAPARPGFSVARDGFIPDEPAKPKAADPFEFSLGPSPFAARSASDAAEPRSERYQDFGAMVPGRDIGREFANLPEPVENKSSGAIEPAAAAEDIAPSEIAPSPEAIATELKAEASHAPLAETALPDSARADTSPAVVPAPAVDTSAPVAAVVPADVVSAAPTVETPVTLTAAGAPTISDLLASTHVAAAAIKSESVAAENDTPASEPAVAITDIVAHPAVEPVASIIEVIAVAEPEAIVESETVVELPAPVIARVENIAPAASALHAGTAATSAVLASLPVLPGAHSMEDTVAELLRPMLRSWLSENMPRIVERALRKEFDDSLHSEHKTAAE